MAARKPTPSDILTLIADRAESLRKAGVLVVQVGDFSAQLAPWTEDAPASTTRDAEREYSDPLHDPSTYPGGRVPGFDRPDDGDRS